MMTDTDKRYLTNEEEHSLIQRAQAGDSTATEELLECHAGYLHKMARRWWRKVRRSTDYDDCFQNTVAATLRAIEKFDLTRDVKFTTYATWWVWQSLGRSRMELDVVRRPFHHRAWPSTKSLNVLVGSDDGVEMQSLLESDLEDDDVFRQLEKREAAAVANKLLKCLPPREREIITLRFSGHTLEELGEKMGVTRERVRQLERRAFVRLKIEADRQKIMLDDFAPRLTDDIFDESPPDTSSKTEIDQAGWIEDPHPPSEEIKGVVYVNDRKYLVARNYLAQGCPVSQVIRLTGFSVKTAYGYAARYAAELNGTIREIRRYRRSAVKEEPVSEDPIVRKR